MYFPDKNEQSASPLVHKAEHERIARLDATLVGIIQEFTFLTPLSWPKEAMRFF